ncbi:MAG: zinc-ribbon domain-containing protein, partial [SAR324 cluster bacterium]|nr:zinc-ribbon domain-containing protein [SAR324 cluster bacterium]
MNCSKCGADNAADASFCLKCGEKLERACGQCGRPLPPGAVFCDSCGAPVAGGKAASDEAAGPAPSAIQGERRQATVLFSDLSGFTAMTEKLDPEEVQGLMRRLKDRAVEIVEAHGGIVSQFVGDEVL